ncbi:questin oxidase family protein [Nonomuraea sp. C10]|uniref:questin oxidase family protein n=1 Tax=Nonomuraea sp. C10 TaxID=2600577 RepID=UPI0011CD6818|nr:questin oxidase family protein [Nonomuraea sp. C10]TXK39778.1 questin oxidase family protein [Nonomuraea sp. C10]
MDDSGTLEEAFERLHRTGPEFDGWLSNHGPMAVESMVRRGHAREVHRWLDAYTARLEEAPGGTRAIGDDWREALGDPRRLGDWLRFFERETKERPWRAVLEEWWPRLLPGIAAGATHGVIRTGHAVHALLELEDDPRLAELGQALGYWAARWQPVAGAAPPSGMETPSGALAGVPRVADQSRDIDHRLRQLAGTGGWEPSVAALAPASGAGEARDRLAALADAATLRYLTHAHGSPVMLIHSATAPTAVLRTLPALPASLWVPSLDAAWAAAAAVTAAYGPAGAVTGRELPAAPGSAQEAFDRAVAHGDEHVIKLADTALDVYERTADPDALAAVVRASRSIQPLKA